MRIARCLALGISLAVSVCAANTHAEEAQAPAQQAPGQKKAKGPKAAKAKKAKAPANAQGGEAVIRIGDRAVTQPELTAALAFEPQATIDRIHSDENYARIFAVQWFHRALFAKAAKADGLIARTPGLSLAANVQREDQIALAYLRQFIEKEHPPTDAEVEQYYKLHQAADCTESARYRLGRIGVVVGRHASEKERAGARERIDAIQAKLKAGESFSDVANQLSDLKEKAGNGEIGWVTEEEMGTEAEGVKLKSLPTGGLTGVETTSRGFEIYKMLEKQEPRQQTLAECRDKLVQKMNQNYFRSVAQQHADKLVERFDASMNLDAFIAAARAVPAAAQPDGGLAAGTARTPANGSVVPGGVAQPGAVAEPHAEMKRAGDG
jgi:hypothetical protein